MVSTAGRKRHPHRAPQVLGVVLAVALSSPVYAAPKAMDTCDGLKAGAALACIRENYPRIHGTVEAACGGLAAQERRACRVREYGVKGIVFAQGATDAPLDDDAADADTPAADVGRRAGNKPTGPKAGHAMKPLNPTAVTIAAIALGVAGGAMQQAPTMCANNPKCTLSPKEQEHLAVFGAIVATEGARVPAILGTKDPDNIKIAALLGVLQGIVDKAPTGLSPAAQSYVDAAIVAVRGMVAAANG